MTPIRIEVEESLRQHCPQFIGGALFAHIANSPRNDALWAEIAGAEEYCRNTYSLESIKQHPAILATREAYKRCGKDPSRYRPSSEALIRRLLNGKGLYAVNTAVDLINLASIRFGYSIGGFDQDKIQGPLLRLGIGREGEAYEGIGRGALNIGNMPVYRDSQGGIGTPTSDHERTKLETGSVNIAAIVNGYDGNRPQVEACLRFIQDGLREYCSCDSGTLLFFPEEG